VLLRLVRDSVLVDTLLIDPRGFVVLPLAGDVRLGDIAGDAVQDTIRSRLARFVSPVAVEAILLRRVRVVGAVGKPGVYYVDRTFTLRDAIAGAGGVTPEGREKRVSLVRAGTTSDMRDWRMGAEGDTVIQSGDELVVGRIPWYQRNAIAVVTAISVLVSLIITVTK
jgi:polysaccharide export outer membrane protein